MSEFETQTEMNREPERESSSSSHHHSHSHSNHSHHSHHSHHSRHGSHSRSRSKEKQSRKRRELKQFLRKNRKKITLIAIALLFCVCSVLAGTFMDNIVHWGDGNSAPTIPVTDDQLRVSVTVFDKPVSLVNSAAQAFLTAEDSINVTDIYYQYRGTETRLDMGAPVVLSYAINAAPYGYEVGEAVFLVSEDEQMTAPTRWVPKQNTYTVECVNLKTNTTYYYRLNLTFTNGVKTAVLGSFTTDVGPRMMTVSGVYNMRDIGGWTTVNGQRIRQGLLYRGCEIDGAVEERYTIDDAGKDAMLNQLKIKTDMDLRTESEITGNANVLGNGVQHTYYNIGMYTEVFQSEHDEALRKIFSDLANPAQYPAYMHCTYGQDRTGTVCYLLGALLGVNEADLMKEYQLSGLHHGLVSANEMDAFVRRIKELPGVTIKDKVEKYLISVGVTPQEIQSIRDIFLEDAQ